LIAGAVIWLLLAGTGLFFAWPWLPRSVLGWSVFVLLSPPVLLAMEWVAKKILPRESPAPSSGRHDRPRISSVLALLVRTLVLLTIFFGAVIVVGALLREHH
jgi:hypothetical protein